jgi:hypothetical protein
MKKKYKKQKRFIDIDIVIVHPDDVSKKKGKSEQGNLKFLLVLKVHHEKGKNNYFFLQSLQTL